MNACSPECWRTARSSLSVTISIEWAWDHLPSLMARMKRDRFLLVISLIVILTADVYFVLLPRLRAWYDLSSGGCSCHGVNDSVGYSEQVLHKKTPTSNFASQTGSKLKRLFGHPLYNIHLPELSPDERLLEEEELMEYYRRKVTRYQRWVQIMNSYFP